MPENKPTQQDRVSPKRRLIRLAVVALALVFAGWISGIGGTFALSHARTHLENGAALSASRWINLAALLRADPGECAFFLARMHRKTSQPDEMRTLLVKARDAGFSPTRIHLEYVLAQAQSGRLQPLESQLSELLVAGNDLSEICEAFVVGCLTSYRLDEALLILEKWLADFPRNAQAHFLRARVQEYRSEVESAEREYRLATQYCPQHSAAWYGLGRMLTGSSPKDAIANFKLCARYHVDPQPALVAISRCHRLLSQLTEARAVMERAIQSPPEKLELAYRLLGEPTETAHSQAPAEFGHVELALKNWAEAEKWYREALDSYPNDWRTRYNLATALRQQGKLDEAAEHLVRVEENRTALEACDTALDLLRNDPENVEARFLIGKTLLKYVSKNQGRVWLQSVLRYSPAHEGAQQLLESSAGDPEISDN